MPAHVIYAETTKVHFSRIDIEYLAERLEARGTSKMLRAREPLCRDLCSAAATFRFMLDRGIPVTGAGVEVTNGLALGAQ